MLSVYNYDSVADITYFLMPEVLKYSYENIDILWQLFPIWCIGRTGASLCPHSKL